MDCRNGTWGWTANRRIWIPEVKITEDDPTAVYVPLRGCSGSLAVFNLEDVCIGWLPIEVLGFPSVKEWMAATGWRDGGY